MSTKTCDNCGGRGYFIINKKVGDKEYRDVRETCSVCKGNGKVEDKSKNNP